MVKLLMPIVLALLFILGGQESMANTKSENGLIALSQELLQTVKNRDNTDKLEKRYKDLSMEKLVEELDTDNKKKAFWMNTYNAYIQIILLENSDLFKKRSEFFSKSRVEIGGLKLSFDDIEHGIIRNSKVKWSGGFIGKIFTADWEKKLRVSEVDYRIHFALNCGAKSCPAVKIYSAENLDQELNASTQKYLKSQVVYNKKEELVKLPVLMSWFRGDFGGKSGSIEIVKKLNLIPEDADPEIEFLSYDWTLDLDNFQ